MDNSESMPINRDFLHEYAKNPQAQQAARIQAPSPKFCIRSNNPIATAA
jgi:hypothetical protein